MDLGYLKTDSLASRIQEIGQEILNSTLEGIICRLLNLKLPDSNVGFISDFSPPKISSDSSSHQLTNFLDSNLGRCPIFEKVGPLIPYSPRYNMSDFLFLELENGLNVTHWRKHSILILVDFLSQLLVEKSDLFIPWAVTTTEMNHGIFVSEV